MNKSIIAGVAATVAIVGTAYLVKRKFSKPTEAPVEAAKAEAPVVNHSFLKTFDSIKKEIAFDANWANGTGYFNGAIEVALKDGEVAKSVAADGRRMIFVGTATGSAVFFERYTPNNGDPFVVVSNVPNEIRKVVMNGSISSETFIKIMQHLTC